jgi:hypothetical protein
MWVGKINEVFIAQHAIDFRKGADSLIAECYALGLNPYLGECVVFVHKSRRILKVIGGDAQGVWVLLRRFEGGALKEMFPFLSDPSFVSATQGELTMLLEGATCEVKGKVKPWKSTSKGDKSTNTVLPSCSYEQKKTEVEKAKETESKVFTGGLRKSTGVGERRTI